MEHRGVVVEALASLVHFPVAARLTYGTFGPEISRGNPSLPLFHVRQLSVTGEGMRMVLLGNTGTVSRVTDRCDIT